MSETTSRPHRHLGVVIYRRGSAEQDALLAGPVAGWLDALFADGRLHGFWFDRSDLRGPHLSLLLTVSRGSFDDLRREAAERLPALLAECPQHAELDDEELMERHRACAGKAIHEVDERPGLAEPETVELFEQPADGYPWGVARRSLDAGDARRLNDAWRRLSRWSLEALRTGDQRHRLALGLLDAVGRGLARHAGEERARRYFRYHGQTLLVGLEDYLRDGPAPAVLLPRLVGEDNRRRFAAWREEPTPPALAPAVDTVDEMTEIVAEGSEDTCLRLLREVLHVVFKQLGLPVAVHIPLVLESWTLRLPEDEAPSPAPVAPATVSTPANTLRETDR